MISLIKKSLSLKYIRFFLVGGSGIFINLLVTGFFQFFVFEQSLFYVASIIGTSVNLIYNFTLHTIFTFNTKSKHKLRFVKFVSYTLILAIFQESLIKIITPIFGVIYLLLIKAIIVFLFSIITYLFFKFYLFNES